MRKIFTIIAVFSMIIMICGILAGCGDSEGSENIQKENEPVGGDIQTAAVIADRSAGSDAEGLITQSTHYSYEDITPEELIDFLSGWTGLDFNAAISSDENGDMNVDWAADSTLIAGLDDREPKEEFRFSDADSMRWFMMDSVWQTLKENFNRDIYYTMNGGSALEFEDLSPIKDFGLGTPYMGSIFYFAHADVKGEDDDGGTQFSYTDEEYGLTIYYPKNFSSVGISDETTGALRFPSQEDDTALLYWIYPNAYGDTKESFGENTTAAETEVHNNGVIGWGNSLNQETGETTYYASFWFVEQEFIACVSINCKTEEDAISWYGSISAGAISVDRADSGSNNGASISKEAAMDILLAALTDRMIEGMAVISTGESEINGRICQTFSFGENTPEKFTAMEHYAITGDGEILILNFSTGEYEPFFA